MTKYYRHRIGLEEDSWCEACGEVEDKDHWFECVAKERIAREEGLTADLLWDEDRVVRFFQRAYPTWVA